MGAGADSAPPEKESRAGCAGMTGSGDFYGANS